MAEQHRAYRISFQRDWGISMKKVELEFKSKFIWLMDSSEDIYLLCIRSYKFYNSIY